jgi:lysophospholipase L1-like esterase
MRTFSVRTIRLLTIFTGLTLSVMGLSRADAPAIKPTSPPSLTVNVSAGNVRMPDGTTVKVAPTKLTFDRPDLHTFETERDKKTGQLPPAPNNHEGYVDAWEPWPGPANPIALSPHYDQDGTLILGGLYRYFREETVQATSEDGTKKYQRGVDFDFNPDWGQIINKDGHMTGRIDAKAEAALPRLDLIEVAPDGTVSIKKGTTAYVCPVLPDADAGLVALAGIYIAPWRAARSPFYDGTSGPPKGTSEYAITKHEINAIHPVEPASPIHPERVADTLKKLETGKPVKIAFMGASVSVGAEAPVWYNKKPYTAEDHSFRGRFVYGLQQRFPSAQITPIEAFKGATTVDYAMEQLPGVLAQKPDLILVDFGVNDLSGPIGGAPNKTPDEYAKSMRELISKCRASGSEVLVIAPGLVMPWLKNHAADRVPVYEKAAIEAADKEGAAAADPIADFNQLGARGIPPWSQIHNWINHPGDLGHEVYAETLLRFFPAPAGESKPAATSATSVAPDGTITFGVAQPDAVQGPWRVEKQILPPLDSIVKQPAPDRPVYGVYCWADEYVKYHDFIKQIGWTTCRLGGPMNDDAMKLIAQDDMEVFDCIAGVRKEGKPVGKFGNRSDFQSDDEFISAYQAYLNEWLERWGPGGTFFKDNPTLPNKPIKLIEIWNEPNFFYLDLPGFIAPKDVAQMNEWNDKRQKLYGKLLVAAYQTIKAKWPDVGVIGFGAGGAAHADTGFIAKVHEFDPDVAHSYDILSTHPYDNSAPPELTRIESFGTWSMADSAQEIRDIMQKYGTSDKPIWYSELNWEISSQEGGFYGTDQPSMHSSSFAHNTQVLQAAYLVRGYAWTVRIGVKRLTYMSLTDTDHCDSGFMNRDGTWRVSAHAIKTMIDLMPRPELRGAVSDDDDSKCIYTFNPDYSNPASHDVIMAWSTTGPKTVEIPWPDAQVDLVDMIGNRQTFPVKDGMVKLRIGPCPIYLAPTKA